MVIWHLNIEGKQAGIEDVEYLKAASIIFWPLGDCITDILSPYEVVWHHADTE